MNTEDLHYPGRLPGYILATSSLIWLAANKDWQAINQVNLLTRYEQQETCTIYVDYMDKQHATT